MPEPINPDGRALVLEVAFPRLAKATGITIIDQIVHFIKQAGAPSEDSYERDGFLSYHAETHAAASGLGIGFMVGARGQLASLGLIYEAVILGNRDLKGGSQSLLEDIREAMSYFLGALVLGVLLGLGARAVAKALGLVGM